MKIKNFFAQLRDKFLNKEIILYLIFGILTTAVGFGAYAIFLHMGLSILVANTISTFIAILFAYATNKIWVFETVAFSVIEVIREFAKFASTRLGSYAVDTLLLILLVEILSYDPMISKAFTSVIVVILNYITSKMLVFNKGD